MNVIFFLVISGVILEGVLAQQTPTGEDRIGNFIYQRCRIYSTDASIYDDFKKHLEQFKDYLTYAASLLPNGKEQFCNDEKPKLIHLAKQLAHDAIPCMPKDEKYLPKFMLDSFTTFLDFACSSRTIENFFSTQGSDCRAALKNNNEGQEVGNCFKKFFARFNDIVRKDDLCLDLNSAKKCFAESISRSCPSFAAFESLNNRFFHAIRKPCNSGTTFGLSSIILVIALISTKMFS